jgi:hypothetical protein
MQIEIGNIGNIGNRKTSFIRFARRVMLSLLIISMNYVQAGEADVMNAKISAKGDGFFRIDVTVKHDDAGWEHYANRWDVLNLDGEILGSRVLAHPHDNEQPFTRSLTLNLPEGISVVIIRAHDSVHGLGGVTFELTIPDA